MQNRELRQAAIILEANGMTTHADDDERVGGNFDKKREGTIRVIAQNVGRIPTRANTTKSHKLMKFMVESNADVFRFSEVGLNWTQVGPADRWEQRTIGKFRTISSNLGWNEHEKASKSAVQFGGVALVVVDDVAHRIQGKGKDPSGLGWWVWTRVEGK